MRIQVHIGVCFEPLKMGCVLDENSTIMQVPVHALMDVHVGREQSARNQVTFACNVASPNVHLSVSNLKMHMPCHCGFVQRRKVI